MDEPWSLTAIDSLFLADLCFTAFSDLDYAGSKVIGAVVSIPVLLVTAVTAFFGGMWVSGNYL